MLETEKEEKEQEHPVFSCQLRLFRFQIRGWQAATMLLSFVDICFRSFEFSHSQSVIPSFSEIILGEFYKVPGIVLFVFVNLIGK